MKRVYVKEEWCLGCHLCEYNCAFANSGATDMAEALKGKPIFPRIHIEESEKIIISEYEELENLISELGFPKFRTLQIFKWLHLGVTDYDEMTDISKNLREKLKEISYVSALEIEKKLVSKLFDKYSRIFLK